MAVPYLAWNFWMMSSCMPWHFPCSGLLTSDYIRCDLDMQGPPGMISVATLWQLLHGP